MTSIFRRLFGLYPGEVREAALFALLGYLYTFASVSGVKFADVLFLLNVGADHFPTVYMLTALGMVAFSIAFIRSVHWYTAYQISKAAMVGGALVFFGVLVMISLEVGRPPTWFWYALRCFSYLFFTVMSTCYWLFIDHYHHLRDAKRHYCLYSSAVFLGAATTGLVLREGSLEVGAVMILVLVLLGLAALLLGYLGRQATPVYDEDEMEASVDADLSLRAFFRGLAASPYAILLMLNTFLIELLTWATEFSYLVYFSNAFGLTGENNVEAGTEYKQFLGDLTLSVGIANLFFGLFIYNRLVRRFGIYSLLPTSSFIIFITFSNWLHTDWILFPILGFVVVEGTRYVIDDNTFNILINGVPTNLKKRIRLASEYFFEPCAMLISGLLLSWSPINSKYLAIGLSGCALVVAISIRFQYLAALYTNLAANVIRFERRLVDWLGRLKTTSGGLTTILRQGDDDARLFATEALLATNDAANLKTLLHYADRFSADTKIKWLEKVSNSAFATDGAVLDKLRLWAYDEDSEQLQAALSHYLASHGLLNPEKAVDDLRSENVIRRGAAIMACRRTHPAMAEEALQALLSSTEEEEICQGIRVLANEASPQDIDTLMPLLRHPSPQVAETAMEAIAYAMEPSGRRYVSTLLSHLTVNRQHTFRMHCLTALGKINDLSLLRPLVSASVHLRPHERRRAEEILCKFGLKAVPELLALTLDTKLPDGCRVLSGRALGHLSPEQLRAHLHSLIELEIDRAYFYFYHAHTIEARFPDLDLGILREGLLSGYHSVLDFILQLLDASGSVKNRELLSRCLRSPNARTRCEVVEALEKTLSPKLFTSLHPLIEELPLQVRLQGCDEERLRVMSLNEVLDILAGSSALRDKVIATTLMRSLDLPHWRAVLRRQMATRDEIFHHFAYELLEA